ncbi:DEAD/DEAH box helicase [Polystyrenella longa]|uniref:DEAD/DEAH box helicase n=1 Tax=Polystyrenella longa TaxID=2528007 RepID=UPI001E4B87A0|nr:DEAD/DEAH box helicase [Polystyrenella longa]
MSIENPVEPPTVMDPVLETFHPVIREWFASRFAGPTEPQVAGWPVIAAGKPTLIAAPTGSGKTLTAFLSCINRLLLSALEGNLAEETQVVYLSPLRALSNDMHRNLEEPLAEITALAQAEGIDMPHLSVGLRTGDTKPSRRASLVRKPPHILVTTPESLYLMLTAGKARETLRQVDTVIVDEIHALVRDKRGSHLALSLERLEHVSERSIQRIGLSATQRPMSRIAKFLVGGWPGESINIEQPGVLEPEPSNGDEPVPMAHPVNPDDEVLPSDYCEIVDVGHARQLDLGIETPRSELQAVCMHEQWDEVNEQLVEMINSHRSTLLFVNTRRMAERLTHQLTELLGEEVIGSHHGSLSAKIRLETERKLKEGELKAVVATASLELGLDIGYIDLVIQIGSPRAISTFLQRIGRSGHSLGLIPKGRLFALTRDELIECMGVIRAVKSGRLDVLPMPEHPYDVLAQQIVAEVAAEEWGTDDLYELFIRAYPYRNLSRKEFDRTIHYLSEGVSQNSVRNLRYLHHDQVQKRIRARKSARITATCNAGAIPEVASYRVVLDPEKTVVGTLDEEFAVESSRGDVFLLGNNSWRIQHVRGSDVTVTDAAGAPPTIPFWQGEAPGRTFELSEEVSLLREALETRLKSQDDEATTTWLAEETFCSEEIARQAVAYCRAQLEAIGLLPNQKQIVFERFFDESGGMQLVVHAPFGAGINRAWGFSMRKRFCRSFDFELQATADDDGWILSLGPQHSFPIESLFPMLTSNNSRGLLEQAVLTVPMFQVRWRWNVTRALLVTKFQFGKKVPPALQRFRADDLLTAVFPKLTGCQEEHTGDHEVPDHPLANQTMEDCLHEIIDIEGLERTLRLVEAGEITLIARDTREPSPFSYGLLNSNPYTFLDGGEVQERRARTVGTRRGMAVESVSDLAHLDPEAIARVRTEAEPLVRTADELHDVLMVRVALPICEGQEWTRFYDQLESEKRAALTRLPNGEEAWVATERVPLFEKIFPNAPLEPVWPVPEALRKDWDSIEAKVLYVRGLLDICGPITATEVAKRLSLEVEHTKLLLEALEGEGTVLRGLFSFGSFQSKSEEEQGTAAATDTEASQDELSTEETSTEQTNTPELAAEREQEWCHRRLLSRIHRLTIAGLRQQIEPVDVPTFLRFLFRHHGLDKKLPRSGSNGVYEVLQLLEGVDAAAMAWERNLLPDRIAEYNPAWLDELCLTGELGWGRLYPPKQDELETGPTATFTRIMPVALWLREDLDWLTAIKPPPESHRLSSPAEEVLEQLRKTGAMFFRELLSETRMLPGHLKAALGELVARGLVTADGFEGLRNLISDKEDKRNGRAQLKRGKLRRRSDTGSAGRWAIWNKELSGEQESGDPGASDQEMIEEVEKSDPKLNPAEEWAWLLLRRWGVVFKDLLQREQGTPSWYELLQVYRRLEARGEIRGGRFIRGVAGEQFGLGETVKQLRELRDEKPQDEYTVVCAADPLNLVGILTEHARVTTSAHNKIVYYNGKPLAALQGGALQSLEDLSAIQMEKVARLLGKQPGKVSDLRSQTFEQLFAEQEEYRKRGTEIDKQEKTDGEESEASPRYPNGIPRPMIG